MQKYPDKIVILKPVDTSEYNDGQYTQVYTGRCRCFLKKDTALRVGKVMDSDYQVVIPDRHMVEIGENFKVGVKMHTSKNNQTWDLVGYVTDFARYDRVCNLNFQMVKENMIYEDIPAPAVDTEKRIYGKVELGGDVTIEGTGVLSKDIIKFSKEPIIINNILSGGASIAVLFTIDDDGHKRILATANYLTEEGCGADGEFYLGYSVEREGKQIEAKSKTCVSQSIDQIVMYLNCVDAENEAHNTFYLRDYDHLPEVFPDLKGGFVELFDKTDEETGEVIEDWLYEYSFKFVK